MALLFRRFEVTQPGCPPLLVACRFMRRRPAILDFAKKQQEPADNGMLEVEPVDPIWDVVNWDLFKEGKWFEIKSGSKFPRQNSKPVINSIPIRGMTKALKDANIRTYKFLIRLCTKLRALDAGKKVHKHLIANGFERIAILNNLLMEMYASCDRIKNMLTIFKYVRRNKYSWTMLLDAYRERGDLVKMRRIFFKMGLRNVPAWILLVTTHARHGYPWLAKAFYDRFINTDAIAGNAVIAGFAMFKELEQARRIFDYMPNRFISTWNAMSTAYIMSGHLSEAIRLLSNMRQRNSYTMNAMVVVYAQIGSISEAKQIYDDMFLEELIHHYPVASNALMAAHLKCGDIHAARCIFDEMEATNAVSWNLMIHGYAQSGHPYEGKILMSKMPEWNMMTWSTMVLGYLDVGQLQESKLLFDEDPERDAALWARMVAEYAKSGQPEPAKEMFRRMPVQDMDSWKETIKGFGRKGQNDVVKDMFMEIVRLEKDAESWRTIIEAFALSGNVWEARKAFGKMPYTDLEAHNTMIQANVMCHRPGRAFKVLKTMQHCNTDTWNGIITAYAQQGNLVKAHNLFNSIERNLGSWNAITKAYAESQFAHEASILRKLMDLEGLQHNETT